MLLNFFRDAGPVILDGNVNGAVDSSGTQNHSCGVGLCGHCQLRDLFICVDGPVLDYPTLAPLVATREL